MAAQEPAAVLPFTAVSDEQPTSGTERTPLNARVDFAAFSVLYDAHLQRVYRYALSRTGSIPDAQDITSQTFIAALEQFHHFQGKSSASTWLLGIARHKVVDHLRYARRQVSLEAVEDTLQAQVVVESAVGYSLEVARVIQVFATLSPDRREALSLYLFGELTIGEVAAVMHRRYSATQMLIQRGLADLRARLPREE